MLAVIEPLWCELRSRMSTRNPAGVSCITTASWSPEFMNRSVARFGVKVAVVASSGSAGACALPLCVMNAKLTGSMPTLFRQSAFWLTGLFWSSDRLSMFSAAHHCRASQDRPGGQETQPGG